nr:phosphatase PAP2 family protein [Nocardioides pantholopis]
MSMTAGCSSPGAGPRTTARRLVPALLELVSVLVLFGAYNLGRLVATGRVAPADDNARAVLDLQAALSLPNEAFLQAQALQVHHLVGLADRYYLLHFPVTIGVLVWLFVHDRTGYRWAKHALVAVTGVAMVVHIVLPVTPPRLLAASGMVDTGQRSGASVYDGSPLSGLANEYAAMPSLHVGWALLLAIVLVVRGSSRWRWVWLLHPVLTTATVVVTANHYLLDAIAGAALVVLSLVWLRPSRRGRPRSTRSARQPAGGTTQVRPHGVRRDPGEEERHQPSGPAGPDRHRGLHHAASGSRGELEGELGTEPAPGALLGPAVRAVQDRGPHPRPQAEGGHVHPGLADPRPAVDLGHPDQAGLPGRPVPRLDQVVEGRLRRDRQVQHPRTVPR